MRRFNILLLPQLRKLGGEPWNSPVYAAYDKDYNFYWVSWKENQHSKNIAENKNVFLVIYDSSVPEGSGEGVYIQAKAYELNDPKEIELGIQCLDVRTNYKHKNPIERFQGKMPRRIYKAVPEKFWVNGEGDVNGEYIDIRVEIKLI